MTAEIVVLSVLFLVLIVLGLIHYSRKQSASQTGTDKTELPGSDCPLCGEFLPRGDRVHTVLFPGNEFDLMRIHGCRHCRGSRNSVKRICPYCKSQIPKDGYVMAQVYRKPYRKTHVHVYGCTVCKPGRG